MAATVLLLALSLCLQSHVDSRSAEATRTRRMASDDPHGGVPMGVSNPFCDDATKYLNVDWDPSSTEEYTCDNNQPLQPAENKFYRNCTDETNRPLHVCLPNPIVYPDDEIPPTSGAHRPLWPDYGEYKYLPPQRWLHNLEHGAIVFLYHPCASDSEVEKMRAVATGCLRKHIITPYKKLPPETPYAAVSWGCKLLMSKVEVPLLTRFVQDHALRAPEGNVAAKGQYSVALEKPAEIVSDYHDQEICPKSSEDDEANPGIGAQTGDFNTNSSPAVDTGPQPSGAVPFGRADNPFPAHSDNPYVIQSLKRRQRLNDESERLRQNVQHLIRAFKRLTEKK